MKRRVSLALCVLLLLVQPARAAIAIVGAAEFFSGNTNGFTSGAVTTTGANFIAVFYAGGTDSAYVLSDSNSNTWIPLTEPTVYFGTRAGRWFYAYNATVGSGHTFTITGTGTSPTLHVIWASGVKSTADPFDTGQQSGHGDGGSATIQAGNNTPSEDGCLVLSGFFKNDIVGGSPSINGGFTKQTETTDTISGHYFGASASLIQTTATAADPTWTISASNIVLASNAVFKAAASGGGGGPTPGAKLPLLGVGAP